MYLFTVLTSPRLNLLILSILIRILIFFSALRILAAGGCQVGV